jgi:hypothetical protein
VPVAVYCWVLPEAIEAAAGVTAIDTKDGLTVSVVELEIDPEVALMVAVPVATALARPFDPAALLIVATLVFEELQVTDWVRS